MDYNRVIVTGRLTKDPDMRYTGGGKPVAQLSLAVNPRKSPDGKQGEEVSFFDIVVFGKQAEVCKEHLFKGRQVLIEGRLRQRRWAAQDGQQRRKVEVVANLVQFLGQPPAKGESEVDTGHEPEVADDEDVPF